MKQRLGVGKSGFIKRVDKSQITTVNDLESCRYEGQPFVRANRGIVGVVGFYAGVHGGALPLVEIW